MQWFMQHNPDEDEFERQNIKKYQGDLLYQRQKYKEALCMYQDSWQCLSPNNAVLGRELTESMALCLLQLGKFEDALVVVRKIQVSFCMKDFESIHAENDVLMVA